MLKILVVGCIVGLVCLACVSAEREPLNIRDYVALHERGVILPSDTVRIYVNASYGGYNGYCGELEDGNVIIYFNETVYPELRNGINGYILLSGYPEITVKGII